MGNGKKHLIITSLGMVFIILGFFIFPKIFKSKKISITQPQEEAMSITEVGETIETEAVPEEDVAEKIEPGDNLESAKPEEKIEKKIVEEKTTSLEIASRLVSRGFEKVNNRKIDTIIIHSSYDLLGNDPYSVNGLINEYKQYGVAPHYLIDRKGGIYRLVEEKNVAYHAGVSEVPDGRTNVNSFSIGIELMNKEDSKFTDEQYESLNRLLRDLKSRYEIKYVLGHNQIAPGRKTDPWNFSWNRI